MRLTSLRLLLGLLLIFRCLGRVWLEDGGVKFGEGDGESVWCGV